MQNVKKTDSCWFWQGYTSKQTGYGSLHLSREKVVYAHRYAYELHNGTIPNNLIVRHTCDTRNCVNPDHLILGTLADNCLDRVRRGRTASGEKNGSAKLNKEQVKKIREEYKPGYITLSEMGRRYGVSHTCIRQIVSGMNWSNA